MESLDAVVVGAGWYGLAAAKTYTEVHPDHNVAVLDAGASLGGTWAKERLYPGLKSNNQVGTYEYGDYPMDLEAYGLKPKDHIPGPVLHQYLTNYAQHFGIYRRIRFNTKVTSAEEKEDGSWLLEIETAGKTSQVTTKKLIVATGLTSQPYMPDFQGSESFNGLIFHSKEFRQHAETLKEMENVTVVGGSKSAWDVAYAYATSGTKVDMVIRESGQGPAWMAPAYVTPLKKWLEKLVHTRFLTWMSPCIWGDEDGYTGMRHFLHQTAFGRKLVNAFWWVLSNDVLSLNNYDKHPETAKLKPWNSALWTGSSLGILNYPTDFFDLVRDGSIRVHIGDITSLSNKNVHLSNGETIPAEALICATGWRALPPIAFRPLRADVKSTFPYYSIPTTTHGSPTDLAQKANMTILSTLPRLQQQPSVKHPGGDHTAEQTTSPFRLYRFMIPPTSLSSRNIAFTGALTNISTAICASIQALWVVAYLDNHLVRLPASEDEASWQTMLHSQFGRWRYPCGYGARFPDFVFDAVPYMDMLLRDLGMRNKRKEGGLKEVFEAYGPEDYRGLVGEWMAGREKL